MEVFAIILGVGLFVGVVAYISHVQEKKRQAALAKIAQEQGYQFAAGEDTSILGQYQQFKLFNRGRSKQGSNSLRKDQDGMLIHAFDYRFTTGGGKSSTTHFRTCISIKGKNLHLPHFFVRREVAVFDFFGKVFGGQDINFDTDEEFSKSFVLQGDNEEKTRKVFEAQHIRDACMNYKGTSATIEGSQEMLLISLSRLTPENTPLEINKALILFSSFLPSE